ncbi:hypothetical protein AMJ49_06020 [Parcubacteria bacterium DG_74_2]|nr:MAG: hypothetical protein AMJ49_06020 [Parcubacteria bacterium DG_74_2]
MQNQFDEDYYFGKVYSNYDEFLDWKKIAKDLIKRFEFNSFLDIGCGCGNLIKEIKKQKPNVNINGVDISEFAVKKANSPFVVLGDCKKLPFQDMAFDMVHILGTFSYISTILDVRQAIKEAYRVAKKTILFDDVYIVPDKKSDDYDPCRKQIFSQEKWLCFWNEAVKKNDTIETDNDEIIIKRFAN